MLPPTSIPSFMVNVSPSLKRNSRLSLPPPRIELTFAMLLIAFDGSAPLLESSPELETLKEIADEQARLRQNLEKVPATSEAYKRYVKKFDDQETQIEKYQADIKKLQATQHSQQKEFDDFLASFSAE